MGQTNFLTAKVAFTEQTKKRNFYSKRKPTKDSTIFLDWDDTLMCTYFLLQKEKKLTEEELNLVHSLGEAVSDLISLCKKNGNVYILTNSSRAWVLSTAKNYLQINSEILEGIYIFSGRDKYSKNYPISQWKTIAYTELSHVLEYSKRILCIGDSITDVEEGKKIKSLYKDVSVATVKFLSHPNNPVKIINEIRLVIKNFDKLLNSNYNMYFEQAKA